MYEILANRVIVEITGSDSSKFLQNLVSNDIIKHKYCYAYMLSSQGRYLFDFFIYQISNQQFLIDISQTQVDLFQKKLMLYKLLATLEIANKEQEYKVLYSYQALKQKKVLISNRDPRYKKLGFRSIVAHDINYNKQIANLYLEDKYKFAIPDGEIDLIYDKAIPVEYGAEELHAVDYQKGCYVGQEVISRAKYQGVIRKKIFKVTAKNNLEINRENNESIASDVNIGILCSSYKNYGIALIREEKYQSLIDHKFTVDGQLIELSIPSWRE